MESNEMIIQAIKSLITEEQINDAIKAAVRNRLEYEFSRALELESKILASAYADKKLDAILDEIYGREVCTETGWNDRKQYATFEEFVKDCVREKCQSQWGMESRVKRMIEDKVEAVCKQVVKDNEADLADKAMRILAGEE